VVSGPNDAFCVVLEGIADESFGLFGGTLSTRLINASVAIVIKPIAAFCCGEYLSNAQGVPFTISAGLLSLFAVSFAGGERVLSCIAGARQAE
jgi:hypothetical protein